MLTFDLNINLSSKCLKLTTSFTDIVKRKLLKCLFWCSALLRNQREFRIYSTLKVFKTKERISLYKQKLHLKYEFIMKCLLEPIIVTLKFLQSDVEKFYILRWINVIEESIIYEFLILTNFHKRVKTETLCSKSRSVLKMIKNIRI